MFIDIPYIKGVRGYINTKICNKSIIDIRIFACYTQGVCGRYGLNKGGNGINEEFKYIIRT